MLRWMVLCLLCLTLAVPISAQEDDPYAIALQRIEEARESNAKYLLLHLGPGLTELPPEIGQVRSLELLNILGNALPILPPEIGQLTNLHSLSLYDNGLTILPSEIGELSNLQLLSLGNNRLTSLPPEIGRLKELKWLNLSNNELTILPSWIGELSNLQELTVGGNHLMTVPPEIGRLLNLCILDLADNNLRSLPSTLGNLNLLAQDEKCYDADSRLNVEGNPLISPPPEVVGQGTSAVLQYLRNQAWYHTQRLIIGAASGVGLLAAFVLGLRYRRLRGKAKRG